MEYDSPTIYNYYIITWIFLYFTRKIINFTIFWLTHILIWWRNFFSILVIRYDHSKFFFDITIAFLAFLVNLDLKKYTYFPFINNSLKYIHFLWFYIQEFIYIFLIGISIFILWYKYRFRKKLPMNCQYWYYKRQ